MDNKTLEAQIHFGNNMKYLWLSLGYPQLAIV